MKIALSALLPAMPDELRRKLSSRGGERVVIPLTQIMPQLAQGAIRFPVAELRRMAPDAFGGVFSDDTSVTLPLDEVLKQLKPDDYPRRAGQRKMAVPDEVTGIFGRDGQKISFSLAPLKEEPKPAEPSSPPVAVPPLPSVEATTITGRSLPMPAWPTMPSPRPAAPTPAVPVETPQPVLAALPPPAPSGNREALQVPLAPLVGQWPEEVQRDVAALNVAEAVLALPLDDTERGLKSGHVAFTWRQLHGFIRPPVPIQPSAAAAEILLELPLKILAPLFMARHRPSIVQRKTAVDEAIPDLFSKTGKVQTTTAARHLAADAAPPTPAPMPRGRIVPIAGHVQLATATASLRLAAPPPATATSPTPAAEVRLDLDAVLGPAVHRFPARDIVLNTAKLPGVTGAILAMSDGLVVTSAVPPQVKAELVAAFLPQIFGRMGQYTKELNMGHLRSISLAVEGGCWQISKQSNIYLAVLTRPEKLLPVPTLATIAEELNKQQQ
ncbi:MAG: roadblock/LC7 domain-containing protein [Verrucomicrobia bacterium]|nr:roadblock/LC7 domain-containing protein [Verrucomicrobiota bacterium]